MTTTQNTPQSNSHFKQLNLSIFSKKGLEEIRRAAVGCDASATRVWHVPSNHKKDVHEATTRDVISRLDQGRPSLPRRSDEDRTESTLARQARIILRVSHELIAERKKTEHLESALATQARKDANMRLTNNLIAERKKTEHLLHRIGMFRSQRNADQAEIAGLGIDLDEARDLLEREQEERRADVAALQRDLGNMSDLIDEQSGDHHVPPMPTHIAAKLLSMDEYTCMICMDNLTEENATFSACGHPYCGNCLAITYAMPEPKCGECRTAFIL
jgi:hypothetical protein